MSYILENHNYKEYFQYLPSIMKKLYVFDELIKRYFKKLSKHLKKKGVQNSQMWAFDHFLVLYTNKIPINFAVRILDIFFNEGEKILYRVGLAKLRFQHKALLAEEEISDIFMNLKDFKMFESIEEDEFFKVAH